CNACTPDPKATTCSMKCGTVNNNCGTAVDCGDTCASMGPGQTCGGGGGSNVCGGTPEAASATCSGKCGTATNNCGQSVSCSAANGGVTCSPANLCGAGGAGPNSCCVPDSMSTTCSGKCGTVTDNCGQMVDCGTTCSTPGYTCGGTN